MRKRSGLIRYQRLSPVKLEQAHIFRAKPTAAEQSLWNRLRSGQIDGLRFRRQQVILGLVGDFYCESAQIAVEADGNVHVDQIEYDAAHDQLLEVRGIRVLRFTNKQILEDGATVAAMIRSQCKERLKTTE